MREKGRKGIAKRERGGIYRNSISLHLSRGVHTYVCMHACMYVVYV